MSGPDEWPAPLRRSVPLPPLNARSPPPPFPPAPADSDSDKQESAGHFKEQPSFIVKGSEGSEPAIAEAPAEQAAARG